MARSLLGVSLTALLLGSCLAPGVDIHPAPTDFAFVEIQLQG
mgnify:CR=1 FL=1